MNRRICYLGDDDLGGAAVYLAGIMTHYGIAFDHVPSTEDAPDAVGSDRYAACVVSDYPAERFGAAAMQRVAEAVESGAGLLMFGGWESYHGLAGEYPGTPLEAALPVRMLDRDDRRNVAQPCLVNRVSNHEILRDLPFDRPPCIGGFNAIEPRDDAELVLTAVEFAAERDANGAFSFERGAEHPLLVVGRRGAGRTAALATDVAPHWVGGFVDWGEERVRQDVGEGFIEVGRWYAEFFRNLLAWAMGPGA